MLMVSASGGGFQNQRRWRAGLLMMCRLLGLQICRVSSEALEFCWL